MDNNSKISSINSKSLINSKLKIITELQTHSRCLYTREQIENSLDKVALEITQQLSTSHPLILCVMTGGLFATASLSMRLDFPLELDYLHVSRYRGKMRAGDLHWRVEPRIPMRDRAVLIIDDILDGGLTFGAIVDYCQSQRAKEVFSMALVDKQTKREKGGLAKADFTALTAPDLFLYGYGLDFEENLRHAPGIFAVEKS